MKKIIISTVLLTASISIHANNFNMPWGNNNGYNNGSSWNMPNMNWGNNGNNGFNNGSSWNMPTMNWGNGYNNGSNMNMPTMNWGNNNGYNNGSNWNMPTMNWGNSGYNGNNGFNNGTNWNMPSMNWGNNNSQPWNFGNSAGYNRSVPNTAMPNVQYRAPAMPVAPQFIPRLNVQQKKAPAPVLQKPVIKKEIKAVAPAVKVAPPAAQAQTKIPMPSEVKGTILTPANEVESVKVKK